MATVRNVSKYVKCYMYNILLLYQCKTRNEYDE